MNFIVFYWYGNLFGIKLSGKSLEGTGSYKYLSVLSESFMHKEMDFFENVKCTKLSSELCVSHARSDFFWNLFNIQLLNLLKFGEAIINQQLNLVEDLFFKITKKTYFFLLQVESLCKVKAKFNNLLRSQISSKFHREYYLYKLSEGNLYLHFLQPGVLVSQRYVKTDAGESTCLLT